MPSAIQVRCLEKLGEHEAAGLSDVLMDCVAGGASVGFMLPLTRSKAETFWRRVGASVARGERAVLVAEAEPGAIVGTVQLIWAQMENQPHRGELAKMLVHRGARDQGVGAALLRAAEEHALRAGKTLLVLDTANETAERLYARHGWQRLGVIPRYALWPQGGFCPTTVLFKDLTVTAGPGRVRS